MTRPRGRPPTPSAMSSAMDPVGMTAIWTTGRSPRRITEPLPNCLSICARARSSALSRSGPATMSATPVFDFPGVFAEELLFNTRVTLDLGSDKNDGRSRPVDDYAAEDNSRTCVRRSSDTPAQAYENTGQCRRAGTRSGYAETTARQIVTV